MHFPINHSPGPMLPLLPPEVLLRISDFLQSPALSHVCAATQAPLGQRHQIVSLPQPKLPLQLPPALASPHLQTLALTVRDGQHAATAAQALASAPALQTLSLLLPAHATCTDPKALTPLGTAPQLRTLTLGLAQTGITAGVLQPLAHSLGKAPVLRTLCLDLSGNALRTPGLVALLQGLGFGTDAGAEARLGGHVPLRTLVLDLWCTELGDGCAQALAGLAKGMASLTDLTLNLNSNALGPESAVALGLLKERQGLRHLTLSLASNGLRATGAQVWDIVHISASPTSLSASHPPSHPPSTAAQQWSDP